VLITDADGGVA